MLSLYEIAHEIRAAMNTEVLDAEDASELIESMDALEVQFEAKAEGCVQYIRSMNAEAEAFKAESKRLADHAAILERRATRIKEYLLSCMYSADITETKAGLSTLKIVKNPWAVEIDENVGCPLEYIVEKIERRPDKKRLADDLKSGKLIEGARLVQSERLEIK